MAHFTVIGLGRFGLTASIELIHMGHTVTGIDKDEKLAEQYAGQLTQTLICDVTDERALKELNLCQSEAVLVAIGEDMQASLLCTLHVKNLGVKDIWVKANTAAHHTILSKLGVTRIVHPEEEMGARVAQALNYPMVSDYLSVGHGNYIVDVHLPSTFQPISLEQIVKGFEHSIHCLLLKREQEVKKSPPSSFIAREHDTLILFGPKEALVRIAPRLK
ncbi:TrkA family potassium uptake protein [Alteromonas sp.]|uniref:potassium channel family protein n=1 Tax=Alteromonas sp. TaxID=232 RepID=UPI000B63C79E|nr:TrkA family potassium uptake protein [Alteromonas sp.]MAI37697.1 potassium transporter TrkA [Alteromonas sp.]OUX87566.1 MAG: potassium transporter TrkA [Alteromonas sp. TMED35]|tara:strand:+ start:6250 stop:6903 length:654 start_codon:yes stop_codon:yes gene_type:complete